MVEPIQTKVKGIYNYRYAIDQQNYKVKLHTAFNLTTLNLPLSERVRYCQIRPVDSAESELVPRIRSDSVYYVEVVAQS